MYFNSCGFVLQWYQGKQGLALNCGVTILWQQYH